MKLVTFAATLALSALAGCASMELNLPADARVESNFGYLAALSYTTTAKGFSVVVKNTKTGEQFGVPLAENVSTLPNLSDKITAIKVPAGTYQIVGWTHGTGLLHDWRPGKLHPVADSFSVQEGSVLALGRFVIDYNSVLKYPLMKEHNAIAVSNVSRKELHDAFRSVYASFNEKAFSCFLCSD